MKKANKILLSSCTVLFIAIMGASIYFINFALTPKKHMEFNEDYEYAIMKNEYPGIAHWIDSIRPQLQSTHLINTDGLKLYARFAKSPSSTPHTAIIIHGYKMNSLSMLHIAYLFHHDLGYNILLPDLQGHGMSEGNLIQMGWKDRNDIKRWIEVADSTFGGNTAITITGISMGGATTMMVAGEQLPDCVKCFVEDCGYTSVWDEFNGELKNRFNLPSFPLLYTTSITNKIWHGWSFSEASSINQVAKCSRPMLFIHGGNDTYVPTQMVHELYKAKAEPKEIYISKGSAHAESYHDHPEQYTIAVRDFVNKYCN